MIQSIALNVACCMTRNVWYKSAEEKKKKLRKSFNGFSFFYLRFIVRNYSVASQMLPPPHYVNAVAQVLLSSFLLFLMVIAIQAAFDRWGRVTSDARASIRSTSISSICRHWRASNKTLASWRWPNKSSPPFRIASRFASLGQRHPQYVSAPFFSIKMSRVFSLWNAQNETEEMVVGWSPCMELESSAVSEAQSVEGSIDLVIAADAPSLDANDLTFEFSDQQYRYI